MVEYISGVIIIGAVCSILAMILPHASESGSGRYVKYISHITVLLVLLAPIGELSSFVSSVSEKLPTSAVTEDADGGTETVISKTAENIARYITEICGDKFGFDTENIRVRLLLDDEDPENVIIDEIQIYTSEKDSEERERAKKYFEEALLTEVYIFGP